MHHVLSDSYQKVLEHFDSAKVLGVTATPDSCLLYTSSDFTRSEIQISKNVLKLDVNTADSIFFK